MRLKRPPILIVDDDASVREALCLALEDDFQVASVESVEEALPLLGESLIAVVLCDLTLPGASGEVLLASIKTSWPQTEVVMLSAAREVEIAVRCMRMGAYDYIVKPSDPDQLRAVVARAAEKWGLARENNLLRQGQSPVALPELRGSSASISALKERIARVAIHDSVVLIQGESGTGKELVAQSLHHLSGRRRERFVAIACGSMPAELVESELFGHERGAFSSAHATRVGKFEYASGGSIFLDDVAVLPLEVQTKLLRVLQEREICRLGSNRSIPVDLRLISSTNVDLRQLVAKGLFREDLFWRLSGVPILVPPLRERGDDAVEIFGYFLGEIAQRYHRSLPSVPDSILRAIRNHSFPGNVRELKHLAETLLVLSDGPSLDPSALPAQMLLAASAEAGRPGVHFLKQGVREFEHQMILRALRQTHGNQSRAAELLGIHRNTLITKMIELNISSRRSEEESRREALKDALP